MENEMSFWADVSELRAIVKQKVKDGHGSNALNAAMAEFEPGQSKRRDTRRRGARRKAVFWGFLLGAVWQGSRRNKR
jgi:hypothetical protein